MSQFPGSTLPMEARLVDEIPMGPQWQYEPKWDGFRCLVRRRREQVDLQSKSGQPLGRYFPDLVKSFLNVKAPQFLLDGEIVIPAGGRLSFDDLLLRVHPAKSRVEKLAAEHPAWFVTFDLLMDERGRDWSKHPLTERRQRLEQFSARFFQSPNLVLSPATTSVAAAKRWFRKVGSDLDGLIAKRVDLPYQFGNRDGMQKIKQRRTVDCVVGGFRYAEGKPVVGSLLLGLYDDQGLLHHVGFTSSFKANQKTAITELVEPLIGPPGFTGRAPGGPSRWSTSRSSEWVSLRPKLVVEVEYDHFTGDRFRHGTTFLRWRPDKRPKNCTLDQIEIPRGGMLALLAGIPARRARH